MRTTITWVSGTLLASGLLLVGCSGEPENRSGTMSSSATVPSPPEATAPDGWALEDWVPELVRYEPDAECAWEALDEAGSDSDYTIDVSAAAALLFLAAGGVHDELSDRTSSYGQPPAEVAARVTSLQKIADEARRAGKRASDACRPEGDPEFPILSTECSKAAGDAQAAGVALERELMSLSSLVAVDDSDWDVDCQL